MASAFVGCANEDLISDNQGNKLAERPVVGAVSLNLVNETLNSRLINESTGNVDWTGMTIGAALMDEVYDISSSDFYTKYKLTSKLYTNYPYARSENGTWDNDALMVEGNYFYYAPYNAALGRDKLSHTIGNVQYAYDNETYANLGMTTTAPYLRHNAQDKNQLYVGYHGFKAGDAKEAINLTMAPAHSIFLIGLANEGSENMTIHKVVLNGDFKLQTNLNPSNKLNYAYIDEEENPQTAANAKLNKRFDLLGEAVPYTHAQNPVSGGMDSENTTSSVTLVMPNYVLAAGASLPPVHVVLPAGYDASGLSLDIYTNKGVLTKQVKSTVADAEGADDIKAAIKNEVHEAVGLRKSVFTTAGVESAGWLAMNATFSELQTNTDYQATVAFDEEASFVVPTNLTVSNTAELEYYLNNWYTGKKTIEDGLKKVETVNVTIANNDGIGINKAIYNYLCGADNSDVVIKQGTLIIPNDATIPNDAIMKIATTTDGKSKLVIAQGMTQTIDFGATAAGATTMYFDNTIINKGILNVTSTDADDVVRIRYNGVENEGTFNINTPVHYSANAGELTNRGVLNVNSALKATTLNNGSETDGDAVMTIAADNEEITKLNNYGELNVNANVTTELNNEQVVEGTTAKVYTNAAVKVAKTKTLKLNAGSVNKGDVTINGMVQVWGNTENAENGDASATIKVAETGELTVQNGAFTNNAAIETSGFIACNSGASFDNNKELTLNAGAFTLVTNNHQDANITCKEINPELKIETSKAGYVTYEMAAADTDLSARNLEINRLRVTCSGVIDLTSIFKCAGETTVDDASTLIKYVEISASTASTFKFAEATQLKSLSIGGANHTIVAVDSEEIKALGVYADKIAIGAEEFEVTSANTISIANATTIFAGETVKNAGRVVVSGYFIAKQEKTDDTTDVEYGHNYILSTGGENRVVWENSTACSWTCTEAEH